MLRCSIAEFMSEIPCPSPSLWTLVESEGTTQCVQQAPPGSYEEGLSFKRLMIFANVFSLSLVFATSCIYSLEILKSFPKPKTEISKNVTLTSSCGLQLVHLSFVLLIAGLIRLHAGNTSFLDSWSHCHLGPWPYLLFRRARKSSSRPPKRKAMRCGGVQFTWWLGSQETAQTPGLILPVAGVRLAIT